MTGVILAGGKAKRFGGTRKSFIEVNGKPIIETQLKLFNKLFDEVIIVANDTVPFIKYDALIVSDILKNKGPLGGIYTALYHMKHDSCFVAGCDMPFLNGRLIRHMMESAGRDWIYSVRIDGRYEPLHTVYSKKCQKTVATMIAGRVLKISPMFGMLKAKCVPDDILKKLDPDLKSFKNINSKEELKTICDGP